MRAGLETSPVTPGSTAPDASFVLPAMVPSTWALASPHNAIPTITDTAARITCRMAYSPPRMRGDPSAAHRLNTAFRVPGRQRAALEGSTQCKEAVKQVRYTAYTAGC